MGEFFLGKIELSPQFPHVAANPLPDIHPVRRAELLTFGLQTMSLISLDFPGEASDQLALNITEGLMAAAENLTIDRDLYLESSLREKVLEHMFLGALLQCLWRRGNRDIEVLHADVDRAGYDIVVECNGVMRHIQLKSSHRLAATSNVKINVNLADKPSGCVVWMLFDPETLDLGPYRWFGGMPNKPLPPLGDKVAKHAKADSAGKKAERPNVRVLTKGKFEMLTTVEEVVEAVFGPIA